MDHKDFPVVVKEAASENRTLLIIGSTENVDRDGDIVMASGWLLDEYMKNPVVLWAHDYSRPPVGKTKAVYVDQRTKQLCFKVYFPTVEELSTPGHPPSDHALFVDAIYNMYKNSFLNATSVGFQAKKQEPRKDQEGTPMWARGNLISQQVLLELSCCPVPANAEALAQSRSMKSVDARGIDMVERAIERSREDTRDKGDEDMADKLTEEEVTKLKEFIATLPKKSAKTEKAGRTHSKATMERINKAIEHATNCMAELKSLASDGVEVGNNDGDQDGSGQDDKTALDDGAAIDAALLAHLKSLDPATLTESQANDILRLGGNHEGA